MQVLRRPVLQKIGGAPLCFAALVLIIESACDRVVGIMDLDHEVGDRELQLVCPQTPGIAARRKPMTHAKEEKDICRLPDDELPALEERRGGWRTPDAPALKHPPHLPPAPPS